MTQTYYKPPSKGYKLVTVKDADGRRNGTWTETPDVRLSGVPSNVELAERWLDDLANAYHFAATYVTASKYTTMRFLAFLAKRGIHLSQVGKREVLDYTKELRSDPRIKSLGTLRRHLNILVSFYRDLGEDDTSGVDEVAWARLAAVRRRQRTNFENGSSPKERRALDEQEVLHLVEGIHDLRDKAIVVVLWATGIRNGEVVMLRACDVSFDDRGATLRLHPHAKRDPTKGDIMVAFTTKEVAEVLAEYLRRAALEPEAPLFPSYSGRALTRTDLNRRIRLWAGRTGINGNSAPDLTTHGLRHTFTTTLRKRGCEDWAIARLRGDTEAGPYTMVSHYFHVTENELRKIYLERFPVVGISPYV